MKNFSAMVLLSLLLISCEKKIIDIVPIIKIENDMTIEGGGDIKYFSFPSASVGFAASDTSLIYKTSDGGLSWDELHILDNGICQGLEFFDEQNGMCLMSGKVYVTNDGGSTWQYRAESQFIGITEDGMGVLTSCRFSRCNIRVTDDMGQSFRYFDEIYNQESTTYARVNGSMLVLVLEDRKLTAVDMNNKERINLRSPGVNANQKINDVFISNELQVVAGKEGIIFDDSRGDFLSRGYEGHTYEYYSTDGFNGLALCVGENTITVNIDTGLDDRWSEVFGPDKNGFENTFYKVRFIDENTFYISGNEGTLFKASI